MPTKKSKLGIKQKQKQKQKQSQKVIVNISQPKSRAKSGTIVTKPPTPQFIPQFISQPSQSFSLADVAKLIGEVKKTPTTSEEKKSLAVQTEPKSETISVAPLVAKGRLQIDENIMNRLTQSKPSIPSISDVEPIKPSINKPISDYFKAPQVPVVPTKKDSKVKKVVIGIENRRMGEEDVLAKESAKEEASRQRQQAKLDYYNRQMNEMPFYQEEEIPYNPIKEVEGIPLVEAEVKPKRQYIKSGKYSKKKSQVIEELP